MRRTMFACPECKQILRACDYGYVDFNSHAGQRINCFKCDTQLAITSLAGVIGVGKPIDGKEQ